MEIDWQPLRQIIEDNQTFVLSSHVRPDADAIGSELGLASLLEAQGKQVRIVNPSEAPDTLRFMDPDGRLTTVGKLKSPTELDGTDVHIVVDTSAWGQLGDLGKLMKKSSSVKVVIDHHVSSDKLGAIEFKDVTAEATGTLIVRLAETYDWPISQDAARWLYCAIATDTGWFRFPSTTAETMRIIGRLIDAGAKPNLLYQQLYEQRSPARLKLAGRVLSRVSFECEGRLAYVSVKWDDFVETGARPVDTEDLVNECLTVAGTQCAFIAVEQMNRQIKFSFRSRRDTNVSAVAEQFGGGGHLKAAGAMLAGPLTEAVTKVLTAMQAALNGSPPA